MNIIQHIHKCVQDLTTIIYSNIMAVHLSPHYNFDHIMNELPLNEKLSLNAAIKVLLRLHQEAEKKNLVKYLSIYPSIFQISYLFISLSIYVYTFLYILYIISLLNSFIVISSFSSISFSLYLSLSFTNTQTQTTHTHTHTQTHTLNLPI